MNDDLNAAPVEGQVEAQAVPADEEIVEPNTALARQVAERLLDAELITEQDGDAVFALLQSGRATPEDWVLFIERTTFTRENDDQQ